MKKIQVFIVFSLIIVCLPLNLLSQEAPPDSFNGKHPRKGAYDRQEDKSKQAMKAIMIKKWLCTNCNRIEESDTQPYCKPCSHIEFSFVLMEISIFFYVFFHLSWLKFP